MWSLFPLAPGPGASTVRFCPPWPLFALAPGPTGPHRAPGPLPANRNPITELSGGPLGALFPETCGPSQSNAAGWLQVRLRGFEGAFVLWREEEELLKIQSIVFDNSLRHLRAEGLSRHRTLCLKQRSPASRRRSAYRSETENTLFISQRSPERSQPRERVELKGGDLFIRI